MSEWTTTTIAEIAEIFDGPHATPKKTESGPWFLSISSLNRGQLDLSQSAHLSEEDFIKWTRRVTPRSGDLLFSYETRLGEAALMPDGLRACLGRRMGLLRPKKEKVSPHFLLYAYLGPDFQNTIQERCVHGATVDRIPLTEMGKWPISLPPREEQEAIASLLRALDDKIAVNDRIAECALELALAKYESMASAAAGWSRRPLRGIAKWLSGGTPKTSESSYWDGDIPWISARSLKVPWIFESDRNVTSLGAASGTRTVPAGTVIFVVRGSSLDNEFRIGLTVREATFGQDCKALLPHDDVDAHTLLVALKANSPEILKLVDQAGHGAGRLSTDLIANFQVALPSAAEAGNAARVFKPLVEAGAQRKQENTRLSEMRDALLPKLMSGEIRIRDAERVVEDAV